MRILIFPLALAFFSSHAQSLDTSNYNMESEQIDSLYRPISIEKIPQAGHVEEYFNSDLNKLIESYNKEKTLKGFKIQLFAGNSKVDAKNIKATCLNYFKNDVPEIIYQSPNFKVRVGNYRNRLEAHRALNNFKKQFPSAFIVQDELIIDSFFSDKKN